MRKSRRAVALIAALSIGSLTSLQALASPIKLEDGSPVRLKLLDSISSGSNHAGDSVSFRVVDDVMAADDTTVLIKAGTPAWGSISVVEERGHIGGKGQLSLTIEGTKSIDGKKVPLRATVSREGQGKLGAVVALSLIICPLFLFMRGKNATIPAGTQVSAYVDRTVLVDTGPASTTPRLAATPGTLSVSGTVMVPPTNAATTIPVGTQPELPKQSEEDRESAQALDKLYESGILTKEEYESKKRALSKKSIALKK